MNKKMTKVILLAVLIAAMAAGAVVIRGRFVKKQAYYADMQAQAESALAAAQGEYDAIDTASLDAETAEMAQLQEQNAALTEENTQMTADGTALDSQISEKQADYDAKASDNEYYVSIYNSLKEGMEKVEGYIDGN